jgi:hypothetical protein
LNICHEQDWTYKYFCQPYDLYDPIGSTKIEPIDKAEHRCFPNRPSMDKYLTCFSILFQFLENGEVIEYGSTSSSKSSVTILGGSLTSNQTYQFKVSMTNLQKSSVQADGYVLVNIVDDDPQLIAVA